MNFNKVEKIGACLVGAGMVLLVVGMLVATVGGIIYGFYSPIPDGVNNVLALLCGGGALVGFVGIFTFIVGMATDRRSK